MEAKAKLVMRSEPHPSDVVLLAFAAGTLDEAQHDAIAWHGTPNIWAAEHGLVLLFAAYVLLLRAM